MSAARVIAGVFGIAVIGSLSEAQEEQMQLQPKWEYVADRVMGGVSSGKMRIHEIAGRRAAHLTGDVSLDNNGGFIQMAFDVSTDATGWTGIEIEVLGNGETYEVRLKTTQLSRPWQSFRAVFEAPEIWTTVRVPFADLEAYRTSARFSAGELRRVGVLAVGRAFTADIAVSDVRFYR